MITRNYWDYAGGSYARYIAVGLYHAYQIRAVRAGGYQVARRFTAFYTDPRSQDSEARRMVARVKALGNPRPYYIAHGVLCVLSLNASIKRRKPSYFPARGYCRSARIPQRKDATRFPG